MFEEYCALAEYVAEDASQVNFQPGDKVLVLSKDESGKNANNNPLIIAWHAVKRFLEQLATVDIS